MCGLCCEKIKMPFTKAPQNYTTKHPHTITQEKNQGEAAQIKEHTPLVNNKLAQNATRFLTQKIKVVLSPKTLFSVHQKRLDNDVFNSLKIFKEIFP